MSSFLVRRSLKLVPAFYVYLLITSMVALLSSGRMDGFGTAVDALFVSCYLPGHAVNFHTWSLAVEAHFYVALCAVIFLMLRFGDPRTPFRFIPQVCAAVAVFSLVCRFAILAVWPDHGNRCHFWSIARIDGLFFGVLISYLYHAHPANFLQFCTRHRITLFLAGFASFVPGFIFPHRENYWMATLGFSLSYLGSGAFLMSMLGTNIGENRVARFLSSLGAQSYSVYLWHPFVDSYAFTYSRWFPLRSWQWFVYLIAYVAGSVLVGIAMAKLIEVPVLALRDRLFPSRAQSALAECAPAPALARATR